MTSIRAFLVLVILAVVCLSNFIAALHGYRDSLKTVDRIEEQQLTEKAAALDVLLGKGYQVPENLFGDEALFQVWQGNALLARSHNAPVTMFQVNGTGWHLKSYEGYQWLVYAVPSLSTDALVIVATQHRAWSSLTEEVLVQAILPIIWVLPIVGLLVWVVVSVGVSPMKQLAEKLTYRSVNDFSPLGNERYAKELVPIVNSLNSLFARLSDAFARERRFSADAAHELRTPLSALKINLHNLSREFNDDETLQGLRRNAERMEHSIEQLLALHRAEIAREHRDISRFDLHALASEVIAEAFDELAEKQQVVELHGGCAPFDGSLASMAMLVRNLVDNASKYTPANGQIRVGVERQGSNVVVLVEDSGPGIPAGERGRVLERFYRAGRDRGNNTVIGSGLGLSIVADIAQAHGGEMRLADSAELGGLSVRIIFPMQQGVPDAPRA